MISGWDGPGPAGSNQVRIGVTADGSTG